jgi:hypothetical protein
VRLAFDGDTLVLASSRGLHRFPAQGPRTEVARDFGDTFALAGRRVVYFDAGKLLESLDGAEPKELAQVAERPRLVAIDQEHAIWVSDGPARGSVLASASGHEIARLTGRVDTMVISGDSAFFLEQGSGGTWRLGRVPLDGGRPTYQDWQNGRVPSTLAPQGDLFYYDGPSRSVRRVSPDLASSEVLARGVICSPLAVADRVLCARVGGLYELPLAGGEAKEVLAQGGFVTALAARAHEVAWVSDVGADRLVVDRRQLP